MNDLPVDAAGLIAASLRDERDLASLAATNRFWHTLINGPDSEVLWATLLAARFGAAAAGAGGGGGAAVAAGPHALPPASERFQRLASLTRPVCQMDKVTWLNGAYLEVVPEPGSTFGRAVRVNNVCWLEVGGRFPGVLPGNYQAIWRCRLRPNFFLDVAGLTARQEVEEDASGGAGAGEGGGGQAGQEELADDSDSGSDSGREGAAESESESEGESESEDGEAAPAQAAGPAAAVREVTQDRLLSMYQLVGGDWFELEGATFEVHHPCSVWLEFLGTSGAWKRGIVFDTARLRRIVPEAHAVDAPVAEPAAAQEAGAGQGLGGVLQNIWGMLRGPAAWR